MKLFMVHCGYYDPEIAQGVYESHINIFAAGPTRESAVASVQDSALFKKRKMHVDGVQEIGEVDGPAATRFKVVLS